MDIYVVTSGSYSEYRIEGVYTELALAEAYVAAAGHDTLIETYEVNQLADVLQSGRIIFKCSIHNDSVYNALPFQILPEGVALNQIQHVKQTHRDTVWYKTEIYVEARDYAHAVKIAADNYAMWKYNEGMIGKVVDTA